ncbi:MAG: hypothetical protein AAF581_14350 [Planctomycetota bacterium]
MTEQHDSMQFRQGTSKDLLRLGLSSPGRPLDQLVELLERVDAAAWLAGALDAHDCLQGAEPFPAGTHTLEQLEALKEQAKQHGSSAAAGSSATHATAGYFVAVAAALNEHGTKISSAPEAELRATLLDLASVTTDAWQQFWMQAARFLEPTE